MRRAVAIPLAVLLGTSMLGCRSAPKLGATAQQVAGAIEVSVQCGSDVWVKVGGKERLGPGTITLSAVSVPLGPQKLVVEGERRGKRSSILVPIERTPVEPELTIESAGSGEAYGCGGDFCPSTLRLGADGKLPLTLKGTPEVKVDIDGQDVVLHDGRATATLSLDKYALDAPLDAVVGGSHKRVEFVSLPVKLAGERAKEGKLPINVRALGWAVETRALKVVDEPIDGAAPATPARSMLFVDRNPGTDRRLDYFGASATLRQVDLVAITRELPPRNGGTCVYEKSGALPHMLVDREIAVHERKTGKLRMKRTLPAPRQCPESNIATLVDGKVQAQTIFTRVPREAVEKVLKAIVP